MPSMALPLKLWDSPDGNRSTRSVGWFSDNKEVCSGGQFPGNRRLVAVCRSGATRPAAERLFPAGPFDPFEGARCQVISTRTGISFFTGMANNEGGSILKSDKVAGTLPVIQIGRTSC